MSTKPRSSCSWPASDAFMQRYHDTEWGVPVRDDRTHFEFLILEGAQAGLSWRTILHRREGYRKAYAGFDTQRVASFGARDIRRLMADPGIIRNRLKVEWSIKNARRFLEITHEHGSFNAYIWRFVNGKTKRNRWRTLEELPATSPESDALSRDLKQRGFSFVGSTIMYAHMQATGLVNDHLVQCFRYREV
ncbi:MAG: DNA-3-methyladenine glycosylase I [Acidobacteriota bacterium]